MWHKFKRSQTLLKFESIGAVSLFPIHRILTLTEHPEQFKLGNLQNFGRSMGHIVLHFCHSLSIIYIHRGVEWVEGFLKNFQKNLENCILIPFLSGIFLLKNKIKIKNYPLSLRVSRKALVLLK